MKLSEILATDAIIPQLAATDRDGAVEEMLDALIAASAVPGDAREEVLQQILEREKRGSTGFGKGVAVPHVKHDNLGQMVASVAVSPTGVDFNALDKGPVYSLVMLLSPTDQPDNHLQAMERIFGHLQKDTFRRFLRQAATREDIAELIEEADSEQLQT